MSFETFGNDRPLVRALALAGKNDRLRNLIFDALRDAEAHAGDRATFREYVRWPLILSLLQDVEAHRVVLENGLILEVSADSRIEKALLLSSEAHPDHVWEPQTTKLLTALARSAGDIIVGGAYIGDHVLFLAQASAGTVHAFEPMKGAFRRLVRHLSINGIGNVMAHPVALWSDSDVELRLEGQPALASSIAVRDPENAGTDTIRSVSIDDYVHSCQLPSVKLIMLDIEGAEENALYGARQTIATNAPNIVFEIHRNFVDWTDGLEKTSIVRFLTSQGYAVFAIRDFHDNYPMAAYPIEIIPVAHVYLEGPPHGFNVLATRDVDLVSRLELRIVENVSPKLLLDKDPALHFPKFTR